MNKNTGKSDPFCWKLNTIYANFAKKEKILKAGLWLYIFVPQDERFTFYRCWNQQNVASLYDVYFYKNVMAEKKCKK